jgi:hypothetical protein
VRGANVFVDDRGDVARQKRVKVKAVFDRNGKCVVIERVERAQDFS